MPKYTNLFTALIAVSLIAASVKADDTEIPNDFSQGQQHGRVPEITERSNASFDKRLPPVLPGEVLNDGHSKTKVWSTSGPVVGNPQVPEAPVAPLAPGSATYGNAQQLPNIGAVIVDNRDGGKFNHNK